jgi:hypothetical protein
VGLKRLAVVFAAGYVVGTRAGEKRFQQISDAWDRFLDIPLIQELTDEVRELVRASTDRATQSIQRTRGRMSPDSEEEEPEVEAEEGEGEGDDEEEPTSRAREGDQARPDEGASSEEQADGQEDGARARPRASRRSSQKTSEPSSRPRGSGRRASGRGRRSTGNPARRARAGGSRDNGSGGIFTRAREVVAVARDRGRVTD